MTTTVAAASRPEQSSAAGSAARCATCEASAGERRDSACQAHVFASVCTPNRETSVPCCAMR